MMPTCAEGVAPFTAAVSFVFLLFPSITRRGRVGVVRCGWEGIKWRKTPLRVTAPGAGAHGISLERPEIGL